MIEFQTIIDFLQEYGKITIKGNGVITRCPLCGDSKKSKTKKRFSITYENGSAFYNCFNCGRSGTFAELYSELKGVSLSIAINKIETPDFTNIISKLTKPVEKEKNIEKKQTLDDILDVSLSIDDVADGYFKKQYKKILTDFVLFRKIPKEYKLFIAYDGEYKGRIIIPIFENGHIVYFQGRATGPDVDPKYKNPEVVKSHIVMNKEFFKRDEYIIVTEGIIDAWMVENHQGTCVLGGSISKDFLSELYKLTDRGIIIATDNDERGEKERDILINKNPYGKTLRYFVTPGDIKDLNELIIKTNLKVVYSYVVANSKTSWSYQVSKSIK
jgi:DNA primase